VDSLRVCAKGRAHFYGLAGARARREEEWGKLEAREPGGLDLEITSSGVRRW
jgi:hypothetical protein